MPKTLSRHLGFQGKRSLLSRISLTIMKTATYWVLGLQRYQETLLAVRYTLCKTPPLERNRVYNAAVCKPITFDLWFLGCRNNFACWSCWSSEHCQLALEWHNVRSFDGTFFKFGHHRITCEPLEFELGGAGVGLVMHGLGLNEFGLVKFCCCVSSKPTDSMLCYVHYYYVLCALYIASTSIDQ